MHYLLLIFTSFLFLTTKGNAQTIGPDGTISIEATPTTPTPPPAVPKYRTVTGTYRDDQLPTDAPYRQENTKGKYGVEEANDVYLHQKNNKNLRTVGKPPEIKTPEVGVSKIVQGIEVNPSLNKGRYLIDSLMESTSTSYLELLPKIVKVYVPDGGFIDRRNNVGETAPNIGGLETAILYLAQAFQCEARTGSTGTMMWTLAVTGMYAGLLMSTWMAYKDVTLGKSGIGETVFNTTIKLGVCGILMGWICPILPVTLIALTNSITKDIGAWYSPNNTGKDDLQLLRANYYTAVSIGLAQANSILYNVNNIVHTSPNQTGIAKFDADIKANKKISSLYEKATHDAEIKEIDALFRSKTTYSDLRAKISTMATLRPKTMLNELTIITRAFLNGQNNTLTAKRPSNTMSAYQTALDAAKAADEKKLQAIFNPLTKIDLSMTRYPSKVVTTAAYTAFAFTGISIWGLGFGSIIWVMLYSFPKDFGLDGVLFQGIKTFLTILLSVVLITIYITASLSHQEATTIDWLEKSWIFLSSFNPFSASPISKIIGQTNGNTLDQMYMAILIGSAPAQAAGIVKGANAVAEKAKEALAGSGIGNTGAGDKMWGSRGNTSSTSTGATTQSSGTPNIINPRSSFKP
jgi:hypothetical protein